MAASQAFPEVSALFCVLTGYVFTLCFPDLSYFKADSKAQTKVKLFSIMSENLLSSRSDTFQTLIICFKEKSFRSMRSHFIRIKYLDGFYLPYRTKRFDFY